MPVSIRSIHAIRKATLSNVETVRTYLEALTAGPDGLTTARGLLADDLEYHDPMMPATTADGLIESLRSMAPHNSRIDLVEIVADGDVVASLTHFEMPDGSKVPFTQWFWLRSGLIQRSQVIYDTAAFRGPGA